MNSHSVHTEYTSDILRLIVKVIVAQMSFDDSRNIVVLGSGVNSNGNQEYSDSSTVDCCIDVTQLSGLSSLTPIPDWW